MFSGQYLGGVDFGGSTLPNNGAFWVKFDAIGQHEWSTSLNGTSVEVFPVGMARDSTGAIAAAGVFNGAIMMFGEPDIVSTGDDLFVFRVGSAGTTSWLLPLHGAGADQLTTVATIGETIVIVGRVGTSIDVGGTTVSNNGGPTFAAALDKDGNTLWAKNLGLGDLASVSAAISGPDHVVLVGSHANQADIGGTVLSGSGTFLAAVSSGGSYLWAKSIFAPTVDAVGGTSDGAIVLAGRFAGVENFGGGPLTSTGTDGYVAKYDAAGEYVGAFGFPEPPDDELSGVVVDANGNVFLAGRSVGPVDLGGGALTGATSDGFVGKLSSDGTHLWSKRFSAPGEQSIFGLAALVGGDVGITGDTFPGALDLGGGDLNPSTYGSFMASFGP